EAVHALHARQGVLQGHRERVTPVKRPGDVGRRHRDRVRLALGGGIGTEIAALLPKRIPLRLHGGRIVPVGNLGRRLAHRPSYSSTGAAFARRQRAGPRRKVSAHGVCSAVAAIETLRGSVPPSVASHAVSARSVAGSRRRSWASGTSLTRLAPALSASGAHGSADRAPPVRCRAVSRRAAFLARDAR